MCINTLSLYIYIYTHTYIYIYTHIHIYTYTYIYIYIYIYVYINIHVKVCMCVKVADAPLETWQTLAAVFVLPLCHLRHVLGGTEHVRQRLSAGAAGHRRGGSLRASGSPLSCLSRFQLLVALRALEEKIPSMHELSVQSAIVSPKPGSVTELDDLEATASSSRLPF